MLPGRNLRIERRRMALTAGRGIRLGRCLRLVRIMACQARHGAIAFQKALRLPKPVGAASHDFELIIMPSTRSVIESQQEITKRFARHKRKWPAVEAA
jgi:hypothetical protein